MKTTIDAMKKARDCIEAYLTGCGMNALEVVKLTDDLAEAIALAEAQTVEPIGLPEGHHCEAWGSTTWCMECGQDLTPSTDKQLIPAKEADLICTHPTPPPNGERAAIFSALNEYRCSEHVDEGGDGMRLVDMLTHGGDIGPGLRELHLLADALSDVHIAIAIANPGEREALINRLLNVKGEFSPYSKEAADIQDSIDIIGAVPYMLGGCPQPDIPHTCADPSGPGALNEWKEAVLDELAITCIDYPIGTPPRDILMGIISMREEMAVANASPPSGDREAHVGLLRMCVEHMRATGRIVDDEGEVTNQIEEAADMLAADAQRGDLNDAFSDGRQPWRQDAQQVAVPQGWKLVPVEPTNEMLACASEHDCDGATASYQTIYTIMLSAAPQPPQQVAVPQEPTQEMVTAYLTENDAYWKRTDELPKANPSTWRQGTTREATRESLCAALAAAPHPPKAERVPMKSPLTFDEVETMYHNTLHRLGFARAIEAHHGIKPLASSPSPISSESRRPRSSA